MRDIAPEALDEIAALIEAGGSIVEVCPCQKRPRAAAWQTKATRDIATVRRWLRAGANVGLLLGGGNLVDVEYDDEAGRQTWERLALPETVAWESARGVHRLYRLSDELPDRAVIHVEGLEIRVGGRAAQSVLPPSIHPSGLPYRWERPPSLTAIATVHLSALAAFAG